LSTVNKSWLSGIKNDFDETKHDIVLILVKKIVKLNIISTNELGENEVEKRRENNVI
jgi:hypothetical protein